MPTRSLVLVLLMVAVAPARADHAAVAPVADAGSLSCGAANRGALAAPAQLPAHGDAWVKPEPWKTRAVDFGTDELVGAIERAAAAVAAQYPGSVLGVADLSRRAGGPISGHRSHQSGRDADLLYYALDADRHYFAPDDVMPVYTFTGRAYYAEAPSWHKRIPERWFDLARNWALVKALIDDPDARVTAIFVSGMIERWLIDYARTIGESRDTIARASLILTSPRGTPAHKDHMHIRVGCSRDDVAAGRCSDENAPRSRRVRVVRCPPLPTS